MEKIQISIKNIYKKIKYESPWLYKNMIRVLGITCVLSALFFFAGIWQQRYESGRTIIRNESGQGTTQEKREVEVDGKEKETIIIDVAERNYTPEEAKKALELAVEELEYRILGKNKSLDEVTSDLNLIKEIEDTPIRVTWELDSYEAMDMYGKIQKEKVPKKGIMVGLKAILNCQGKQVVHGMHAVLYPPKLSGEEKLKEQLTQAATQTERETGSRKKFSLPDVLSGKKLRWKKPMDMRWLQVLAMGVLIAGLLVLLEKQKKEEANKERKKQLLLDYPEIVSKFTLLIGAGMTVDGCFKKITEEYRRQKAVLGNRPAYEEMCRTNVERESGISEVESYIRFGKRCEIKEYIKFGALLSQNLRKGTKGLSTMLEMESKQAFENRKALAKRMGEEAGTKLLFPMFLMLAVVLVIVIVPAFLSMGV